MEVKLAQVKVVKINKKFKTVVLEISKKGSVNSEPCQLSCTEGDIIELKYNLEGIVIDGIEHKVKQRYFTI